MVDFKKLRESKAKPKPINPREIFNALPKPPGINDLYASQAEVLDTWFARRTEKDVVVKLHTGGGKTLVALLMAQSVMNEIGEPVLYLAPTNQLVSQVIAKSQEYGISAHPYTKGQPLAAEFYDGKSVLVGAYETLFTGRSKFGVRGDGRAPVKVGAIILDDAHVALTSVREAFTLTISAREHPEVYSDLAGRFRTAFRDVNRGGSFADITNGKDYGVIEVPSWAWNCKLPELQDFLAQHVDAIDFMFGRFSVTALRSAIACSAETPWRSRRYSRRSTSSRPSTTARAASTCPPRSRTTARSCARSGLRPRRSLNRSHRPHWRASASV